MYKIISENNICINKWINLLSENKFASVFQSPEFYNNYNTIKNHKAIIIAIENNNKYESLCVITLQKEIGIKGFFSRRAIIYGGPLVTNAISYEKLLIEIEKKVNKKVIYTEIRNYSDYSLYRNLLENYKWQYEPYLNFKLELENSNFEELLSKMKYNRRREIRQSIESGATYYVTKKYSEVQSLYNILQDLYKTRVKLPLPPLIFFEKLFLSNIGLAIIVKHNNTIIGGAFCLYLPNLELYTMYYCGLRDYSKKIFPTHLAIVGAIKESLSLNLKTLDFMGAGKKNQEYGVRKYKEEFGGVLVDHGRFIKINNNLLYSIGKLGLSIIKKIKSS